MRREGERERERERESGEYIDIKRGSAKGTDKQ